MSAEATKAVHRYEVPIDDRPHWIALTDDPFRVAAARGFALVEFWAEHDESRPSRRRAFQVFGTGHDIPVSAKWWGTCSRTAQGFVWHLYELAIEEPDQSRETSQ